MTVVVKLGGAVFAHDEQVAAIADDVRTIHESHPVFVVHGGGPQATELSKRLGIEPNIVGGRRVTDAETLEVCKMVFAGKLNVDLTATFVSRGVRAIGVSGASNLIHTVKRPPRLVSGGGDTPVDFGHVGDITGVNHDVLSLFRDNGWVPLIATLGIDNSGNVFNINADISATRIAASLGASHLVLIAGNVPGVLRDKDDVTTRIKRLTVSEARSAIEDGTIQGGMIPKIEESLAVIESGVGTIHIMGEIGPGMILEELAQPGRHGTALVPD